MPLVIPGLTRGRKRGRPFQIAGHQPGTPTVPNPGLAAHVPARPAPAAAPSAEQQHHLANPRAAAPQPATHLEVVSQRVGVDQASTGTAPVGPVRTWSLPVLADITRLTLGLSGTVSSGASGAGTLQTTTIISQVIIKGRDGAPVMFLLGEDLHAQYQRFSEFRNDFTDSALTITANMSNAALNAATFDVFTRLPAHAGPYTIEFVYINTGGAGAWGTNNRPQITAATNVTAISINVAIDCQFGDAQGFEMHSVIASFPIAGSLNDLSQLIPVRERTVLDVWIYNATQSGAVDADLDHVTVIVNGASIEPFTSQAVLASRNTRVIQSTRPTATWWLLPTSQIAFNASSSFQVFMISAPVTNAYRFLFYFLQPV
jgi:hypothetical protein